MKPARLLIALLVAMCLAVLAACGGGADSTDGRRDSAKALSQEQAELLATVRFRNFDAGVRAVVITIPDSTGTAGSGGRVEGWVDFVAHLGYAAVDQGDTPIGAFAWSADRVAVNETATGPATLPVPGSGWRSETLDAQASPLTRSLAIVLNLASDRPENPLLLRQSDAAFLRADELDGRPVMVLAGPSPAGATATAAPEASDRIRYWIDDEGLLLRAQVKLPGTTGWTSIDLADAGGTTLDPDKLAAALGAS